MSSNDSMLDIYIFETLQLLENLENVTLQGERGGELSAEQIDEVFRIMHSIKGSSGMMEYNTLMKLAHAVEDMFSEIRRKRPRSSDWDMISDIILTSGDFIKGEIVKLQTGIEPDGVADSMITSIREYVDMLQGRKAQPAAGEVKEGQEGCYIDLPGKLYIAKVNFDEGCQMETIRAFAIVNNLMPYCTAIVTEPKDLMDSSNDTEIAHGGLKMFFKSKEDTAMLRSLIEDTIFIKKFSFNEARPDDRLPLQFVSKKEAAAKTDAEPKVQAVETQPAAIPAKVSPADTVKQNYISVNISKLDALMDLVGEIVTTESMVVKSPDLQGLVLDNFEKATGQLKKLTSELQDLVMSIRMVPISAMFHKMQRIVRDMEKKIGKEAELVIIGEETEVDKNILDNLSDPLMHIIRNAMDHGLEGPDERIRKGKSEIGTITLEARNIGGDVHIIVTDDGKGLNKSKIVAKAIEQGLVNKPEHEISDKEAFSYVFMPGFSTKDEVTEFSGRGVGMDVVRRNIEKVGGKISIESEYDKGTSVIIKIPLTLAILDGMQLSVGETTFVLALQSIRESFKAKASEMIHDPAGREMIAIRNQVLPIIRLCDYFGIEGRARELSEGILMLVEADMKEVVIFCDKLIGELQAVVKPLPEYIIRQGASSALSGCCILGNGNISLIMDLSGFGG